MLRGTELCASKSTKQIGILDNHSKTSAKPPALLKNCKFNNLTPRVTGIAMGQVQTFARYGYQTGSGGRFRFCGHVLKR